MIRYVKEMEKDRVFAQKKDIVAPFQFNETVTRVFDDMLQRSVPLYRESILRQAQLAKRFYRTGTRMYDLGCSNGNLGLTILDEMENQTFSMIAVDSSLPMIRTYAGRLVPYPAGRIHLVCGLLENVKIENASVVLINLTLQFLAPEKRDRLIHRIYDGMEPGGILLLTEKTVHPDQETDALEVAFYKRFKRENGYSDLEISQKRDALEKVLIPDTLDIHRQRIADAGFSGFDIWMKWFNFVSMMAVKM